MRKFAWLTFSFFSRINAPCSPLKFSGNKCYSFASSRIFLQATLAVRKLVERYFFIVGKRLFFGLPSEKRAPKNGDEKESRRAGHFLIAGREYVGFTSCGGNKTSILTIARSCAQKNHLCGNNHNGANFSYCHVKNIYSHEHVYLIFSDPLKIFLFFSFFLTNIILNFIFSQRIFKKKN